VILYDEGTCAALRVAELAEELARVAGVEVEARGEFVRHWATAPGKDACATTARAGGRTHGSAPTTVEGLAKALARARVVDPMSRLQPEREPTAVEIAAEQRVLDTPGRAAVGILYDGAVAQWWMGEWMEGAEEGECHILLTARLLGTFMPDDHRWHAHTVLLGEPALISTTGLVQAPARPREYYQGQGLATTGLMPREVVEAELQQRLADRMLLPDDPRINAAALGCALQAIAFHVTGEAFCEEPTCRLYNARRQEELIRSQCSEDAGLCERHDALFRGLREGRRG